MGVQREESDAYVSATAGGRSYCPPSDCNSEALAIVSANFSSADFFAALINLRATLVTPPQKAPEPPSDSPDPDTDVARSVPLGPLMLTSQTIVVVTLHDQLVK